MFEIEREGVGKKFFKCFGSLVGGIDAVKAVAIDGAEEEFEAFDLVEEFATGGGGSFEEMAKEDV